MHRSERAQKQMLGIGVASALSAATWASFTISHSLASHFNLGIYLATNVLVFIDSIDLLIRAFIMGFGQERQEDPALTSREKPVKDESAHLSLFQKRLHVRPWAIAVSVHNAETALFEFLASVDYLRERMWIIDDGSSDGTCDYLRTTGWRCFRSEANLKKPGAIEALIRSLPSDIESILVIDPDIDIASRSGMQLAVIEEVLFDFQQSGLAAICPRLAIRPEGFLSKFQMLEYSVAFYGRRSLGDSSITSGISVYRRNTFCSALARHSKSVYAEDLENSILLLGMGARVQAEPRLVIHTESKITLRSWFSQRIGWAYGLIKVYFERFRDIRTISKRSTAGVYQYICYMGIFSLAVEPIKAMSLILLAFSFSKGLMMLMGVSTDETLTVFEPIYFLVAFGKYLVLMIITWFTVVPRDERKEVAVILPLYIFYALLLTAATCVGYINWLTIRLLGRRLVKDHYDDGEEIRYRNRRGIQTSWS